MATVLVSKLINASVCEYTFCPTYPVTHEVIKAMLLLLKYNMDDFAPFRWEEKSNKLTALDDIFSLTSDDVIAVTGCDKYSAIDMAVLLYPNSHKITIRTKHTPAGCTNTERSSERLTDEEKEVYLSSFCGTLEIKAHCYITAGQCYNKLFAAARQYVNSNFDKKYEVFEDDGYSLNLAFLFSSLKKE